MFRCYVVNALITGLEALVLSQGLQCKRKVCWSKLARRALCGTQTQTEDDPHSKVLTVNEVLRRLSAPNIEMLFRVARLNILKSMVRYPQRFVQAIGVLFGSAPWDVHNDVNASGELNTINNESWVTHVLRDIVALSKCTPMDEYADLIV